MDLLDDTITNDQINEFKRSLVEAQGKSVEDKLNAEFSLAWALVRSQQKSHIQEGIDLFQVLIAKDPNPDSKRAFLLYLAVGYFKINDYDYAISIVDSLLRNEPNNHQAQHLKDEMKRRVKKRAYIGAAVGGIAATTVALGLMLLKRK